MGRSACYWLVYAAATVASASAQDFAAIAGYTPGSDVVERNELDLDILDMETGIDLFTETGFETAFTAYSTGGNSLRSDGSIRTVQEFSTTAEEVLAGEPYFGIWSDFWGAPDYGDIFTTAACQGTGNFSDASLETRNQLCQKGAQYQNVWMYVIHELEDAVADCSAGNLTANDGGVQAWDEGWAYYAGSLEGEEGGGSDGQMLYGLAQKRCKNFGTCTGDDDATMFDGVAQVNQDILAQWNNGSQSLLDGECDTAGAVRDTIVRLMVVPLIQAVQRYSFLADPEGGAGDEGDAAELWAFTAAILPLIDSCDADVATMLRANADVNSPSAPVSDGYLAVKEMVESTYECMQITCTQVGGLFDEDTAEFFPGFDECLGTPLTAATDTEDGDEEGEDATEDGEDATEDGEDATEDGEDTTEDDEDTTEDGEDADADGGVAGEDASGANGLSGGGVASFVVAVVLSLSLAW